jgi:hypothetical protein
MSEAASDDDDAAYVDPAALVSVEVDVVSSSLQRCASRGDVDVGSDRDYEPSEGGSSSEDECGQDFDRRGLNVRLSSHGDQCKCLSFLSDPELAAVRKEALEMSGEFKSGLTTGLILAHLSRPRPSSLVEAVVRWSDEC